MPKSALDKESFFGKKESSEIKSKNISFNLKFLKLNKKLFKNKKFIFGLILVVIILVAIVTPVRTKILSLVNPQTKTSQAKEIDKLLHDVGKIVLLPSDETPTVATVSDITKLEDQPFFRNAKNGDKVIIYAGIRKAILYRPSLKKVIEMSTIAEGALGQAAPAPTTPPVTTTPTPTESEKPLRIVILNGTKESGLAKKAADLVKSESVEIVSTGNTKEDYQTTSISSVDTSNNIKESQLLSAVKAITKVSPKIIELPDGETKPSNADAVIILGEDFAKAY